MYKALKRHYIVFFVLILSLFLTSCLQKKPIEKPQPQNPSIQTPAAPSKTPSVQTENEDEIKDQDIADYFPLSVGSKWQYVGVGNEYASYIQEVIYNEKNRYQLRTDNGGAVTFNVYEVEKDKIVNTIRIPKGLKDESILSQPSNLSIILLQLPLKVGNRWISEENTYEITSVDATIKVPAGEFKNCIEVKETFKDEISYQLFYFKKGVGLIKTEFNTGIEDVVTSSLQDYVIK